MTTNMTRVFVVPGLDSPSRMHTYVTRLSSQVFFFPQAIHPLYSTQSTLPCPWPCSLWWMHTPHRYVPKVDLLKKEHREELVEFTLQLVEFVVLITHAVLCLAWRLLRGKWIVS